jgi:FkbM family methyltransferase
MLDVVTLGRGIPRSVNGRIVRFPARWPRFYPRVYEPEKATFLKERTRPATLAIDVGAHLGVFSIDMADADGPHGTVMSFEPNSDTRAALRRVVRLNRLEGRVIIRGDAIGDRTGTMPFFGEAGANASSLFPNDRSHGGVDVRITTLDDLLADTELPISCVKIDAEGAEAAVLRGARKVLAAHRPALAIEVHPLALKRPHSSTRETLDLLESLGFTLRLDGASVDRAMLESRSEPFELQAVPDRDRA